MTPPDVETYQRGHRDGNMRTERDWDDLYAQYWATVAEYEKLRARLATAETLIRYLMQSVDRAGFGVAIQPTPDNMPMINLLDDLGWGNPLAKESKK